MAGIRVGTSGFSFDDWVGPVYPKSLAKSRMLEYYEQALGFDTVELNYTYYAMPMTRTLEAMAKRTGKDFRFVVRSHKEMTHEIWTDESRKQFKDTSEAFRRFHQALAPLTDTGKLGCVLVQMPSFFWPNAASYDYLRRLPERLPGVPLVVEFRNKAWVRESAVRLLEEAKMGYCVVDEPKLPRLMPFDPRVTSDVAYFRFHGRNKNWFKASREERYNYLYSEDELKGLARPIREISGGLGHGPTSHPITSPSRGREQKGGEKGPGDASRQVFVFFNNCHAGAAARNAVMMKQMLGLVEKLRPEQVRLVEGEQSVSGGELSFD